MIYILFGILLPFFGTVSGGAAVFILKNGLASSEKIMSAFAAGVMTAASVWSLIIPATEMCENAESLAFLPVLIGICAGSSVMLLLEKIYTKIKTDTVLGKQFTAVTLHNFPEGMAVGLMFSQYLSERSESALAAAFTFSFAVAIQNVPEGAIISLPDYAERKNKLRAFSLGVLSGIVEPLGAALTLIAASLTEKILPCFFGFAAGTMLYVVADGLLEKNEENPTVVPLSFILGFSLMMTLDIATG